MISRDDDYDDDTEHAASTDDVTTDDVVIICNRTTPYRKVHPPQVRVRRIILLETPQPPILSV